MPDNQLTQDRLTKEHLKEILDLAMLDTSYDNEGDLKVKENVNCWVLPNKEQNRIRLLVIFRFKPLATRLQRLEFVNKVNDSFIIARASAGENNDLLFFTYDIAIASEISPKTHN